MDAFLLKDRVAVFILGTPPEAPYRQSATLLVVVDTIHNEFYDFHDFLPTTMGLERKRLIVLINFMVSH